MNISRFERGRFEIYVKRGGPVWDGCELMQFHTNNDEDAIYYGRHCVKMTADVVKIELRREGEPMLTLYARAEPK
jgi:hypothetical protein